MYHYPRTTAEEPRETRTLTPRTAEKTAKNQKPRETRAILTPRTAGKNSKKQKPQETRVTLTPRTAEKTAKTRHQVQLQKY